MSIIMYITIPSITIPEYVTPSRLSGVPVTPRAASANNSDPQKREYWNSLHAPNPDSLPHLFHSKFPDQHEKNAG